MAQSRLEKIGTIFTRVNGLLKTGAMKWDDRPLWYDIYKAFPPTDEPRFDRPAPDKQVPSIFYVEDNIRAHFHKYNKKLGTINMFNNESQTKTKKFIEIYKTIEASGNLPKEKIYENAIQKLNVEYGKHSDENIKEPSLASSFKEAQEEQSHKPDKVNIATLFKE